MSYQIREQETVIVYDVELDRWTIETSYRKHITIIQKKPEAYNVLERETEKGRTVYLTAEMLIGENFSISPFPRLKRKLSEEERKKSSERLEKHRKLLQTTTKPYKK